MAMEFTAENFDSTLQSGVPVLVDFWAPWCGPCRMVGPFIEELAREYQGKAVVGKVNVDEQPTIAARYGVATIPTILIFVNGEIVEKAVGARPKAAFVEMLEKHL